LCCSLRHRPHPAPPHLMAGEPPDIPGPPFAAFPPAAAATSVVALLDGREMPLFGLGVYRSAPGAETENAVLWSLQAGYRLIDSASLYQNEASVGAALQKSGVPRNEVFITTKLWDSDHGYESAIDACNKSLKKLGTDYIDLYLIHSPNTGKLVETWDAFVELQRRGLVRSIGVSNMDIPHIEALIQHHRPLPVVNQFEMHPMIWEEREALLNFCKSKGIIVQAYGSIFAGKPRCLSDQSLVRVGAECKKSVGQVLLRWGHQMGFAIIPKSVQRHRIAENMDIFDFELTPKQMAAIASIRGRLGSYWNPLEAGVHLGDTSRGHSVKGGDPMGAGASALGRCCKQ